MSEINSNTTFPLQKISLDKWYSRPIFLGVRLLAHTIGDEDKERVEITYDTPQGKRGYIFINRNNEPEHWLYEAYGSDVVFNHQLSYQEIIGIAQAARRSQAEVDRHNVERAG